jgi:hypothetical protein
LTTATGSVRAHVQSNRDIAPDRHACPSASLKTQMIRRPDGSSNSEGACVSGDDRLPHT